MEMLRILVTDDEPGMRMAVERALRGFTTRVPDIDVDVSFTIDQAETGEEALEKILAAPPDILLLDHKLPGMSGLDVLDRLASQEIETLTIMITAYASIETAVTATKRGAYDFLAKPFTPAELKGTIRKAAARLILARQARRLEHEKRQVRFQFIRVLGHELKAPLNAVAGYLQILDRRTLGPEVAVYAQMIDRSLARLDSMRKLIEDLLDMTRIESGQFQRELEPLDLREVAAEAVEIARGPAREGGLTVELHADEAVPMTADRRELEMILNNLVSNAVKYNRPEGRVDVTVAAEADQAIVRVADTGIGMSPEDTAKLFNEFVRIRNEKTRNVLGSGLGLSIVRKLVLLYQGGIEVASTPDVGSTFTVRLNRTGEQVTG